MLKRIFFAVLLAALLPLCAQAAQESRMTPELAEKVLLECRRGDTFQILKGYNFTREEYKKMEMYLHDWQKYSMIDYEIPHLEVSRGALELIVQDILGKLLFDNILECKFIDIREEESAAYVYYIVDVKNGKETEIYVVFSEVIEDPKLYDILKKDVELKIYVKKVRHGIQAVKIMTLPLDNDYITTCKENYICGPRISDQQIMALRHDMATKR